MISHGYGDVYAIVVSGNQRDNITFVDTNSSRPPPGQHVFTIEIASINLEKGSAAEE